MGRSSLVVCLILLAAGARASNPLFDALGTGKAIGDQLGGNVTKQANAMLNEAATDIANQINATVAPLRAKVDGVLGAVNAALEPINNQVENLVLDPVRGAVKAVADGVQAKVEAAAKLLPTGKVDAWKSAVLLAWLKESGVYDLLNSTFPAGGFKIPDVPAEIQKAQLQKLALLAQLNSTLASAQQLRNALLLSVLKESGVAAKLSAVQNATGLPLASLLPSDGPAGGMPSFDLPDMPAAPALKLPNATALRASLPMVSADDLLNRLNLTGRASMAEEQLAALAAGLGIGGVGNATGVAALKDAIVLSILKELPGGDAKAARYADASHALQVAFGSAKAAVKSSMDAKLKAANDALSALAKHVDALKANPVATVAGNVEAAVKAAQAAADAKVAAAGALLDAANAAAKQLSDAKASLIASPSDTLQALVGNATAQLEGKLKAAADAVGAAQKQAASLVDSTLSALGLGGVAANASKVTEGRLVASNHALSNITQVSETLKASSIQAANAAIASATKQAQAGLDAKIAAAAALVAAANKQAEQLTAAKLAAATGVQQAGESMLTELTKQVASKVAAADAVIAGAQRQAAAVIDAKLMGLGLPGVAANATQRLQGQVAQLGAAYQNLTGLAAIAKTNPSKAANDAIAMGQTQINAALDAKVKLLSDAYHKVLMTAQSVVAVQLQVVGGAQSQASQVLATVMQQYEAQSKAASKALAAAKAQVNAAADAKLAYVGLAGLATNTSALIDGQLQAAQDKVAALMRQASAAKAAPVKAANDALAAGTKQAQAALDSKIRAANGFIGEANKLANSLLAAKAEASSGATEGAQQLLGELSKSLEGALKQTNDAVAAGQKQVAALKAAMGLPAPANATAA
ncbi:MAG: hypothetical protein J3K34DRAFT_398858 [Monoraphidium minutum]|nr:MAG: hypothetical protein J3K34DRAFT_398858 [Monoraphidium minutum]